MLDLGGFEVWDPIPDVDRTSRPHQPQVQKELDTLSKRLSETEQVDPKKNRRMIWETLGEICGEKNLKNNCIRAMYWGQNRMQPAEKGNKYNFSLPPRKIFLSVNNFSSVYSLKQWQYGLFQTRSSHLRRFLSNNHHFVS